MYRPPIVLSALAILLVTSGAREGSEAARGTASRSVVWAQHGMVCAAQPLAVQAGVDILRQGGSAVDAAIAVNACLGLMEPTANGLGGDLFALVWDPKTRQVVGLNASGRAPLALTAEQVPPDSEGTVPLLSRYAWTVPGACDGWFELHAKYGKLPMRAVLAPAIRYAEKGFPVSPVIAENWATGARRNADKPGFQEVFTRGRALQAWAFEKRTIASAMGPPVVRYRAPSRRTERRRTSPATARPGTRRSPRNTVATRSGSCPRRARDWRRCSS